MATLEELKAQKREIEKQIRLLENPTITCGRAKFGKDVVGVDAWCVRIKCPTRFGYKHSVRWLSIIEDEDRNKAIDALDAIIVDLTELRKTVTT